MQAQHGWWNNAIALKWSPAVGERLFQDACASRPVLTLDAALKNSQHRQTVSPWVLRRTVPETGPSKRTTCGHGTVDRSKCSLPTSHHFSLLFSLAALHCSSWRLSSWRLTASSTLNWLEWAHSDTITADTRPLRVLSTLTTWRRSQCLGFQTAISNEKKKQAVSYFVQKMHL